MSASGARTSPRALYAACTPIISLERICSMNASSWLSVTKKIPVVADRTTINVETAKVMAMRSRKPRLIIGSPSLLSYEPVAETVDVLDRIAPAGPRERTTQKVHLAAQRIARGLFFAPHRRFELRP